MVDLFRDSVRAVLANGRRLLDDAESLEFSDPPATAYFLAVTAQEEFAKAFLLELAQRQVIPWSQHIHRATRDHQCKQLLCSVMDYLEPDVDEFIKRHSAYAQHPEPAPLPAKVADALNILRHEKIGRWESPAWVWEEDPEYDPDALGIAEGKRDRQKQDALYLRLGRDGSVTTSIMGITRALVQDEMDRARRIAGLVERLHDEPPHTGLDYEHVENVLRLLFSPSEDRATGV